MVRKKQTSLFGSLFGGSRAARSPAPKRRRGVAPLFASFSSEMLGEPKRALVSKTVPLSVSGGLRSAGRAVGLQQNLLNRTKKQSRAARRGLAGRGRGFGKGHFRTMCVRLCDGYYFPVSFKTGAGNLKSDEMRCNAGCASSPTKLFYYSNPGGEIKNMHSLDGTPYKDIKNAFRFKKEYVANCRCQPEPWSKEAREQHEEFALVEKEQAEEGRVAQIKLEVEKDTAQIIPFKAVSARTGTSRSSLQ